MGCNIVKVICDSGISKGGPKGASAPSLLLEQTKAQRAEKIWGGDRAPPYLKVWIWHCVKLLRLIQWQDSIYLNEKANWNFLLLLLSSKYPRIILRHLVKKIWRDFFKFLLIK